MSFNTSVSTKSTKTTTHEGGKAYLQSPKEELYTLVAGSLMSGDAFYETQDDRMERFRALVAQVAKEKSGPEFIAALTKYTRDEMYLRTTPAMLAGEAFTLHLGEYADRAAEYAWRRGDDHLETLAYVKATGVDFPHGLLDEVAKRLNRLNEYSAVKYARSTRSFSQKDAIKLSHPKPKDAKQSALFKYLIHGWDKLSTEEQGLLTEVRKLKEDGEALTWEQHISKAGSSTESWTKAFELMGYMALLRNLRNLLQKGVSKEIIEKAAAFLSDPEEVRKSKQLPYRFLSAWRALPHDAPAVLRKAVSTAINLSVNNLPDLQGRTLVLVDTSGSMSAMVSDKSGISCVDAAATLGGVIAQKTDGAVWAFASSAKHVTFVPGTPVLEVTEKVLQAGQRLGCGTEMAASLREALDSSKKDFDRIIILSDMQAMDDVYPVLQRYRKRNPDVKFYAINMAGYGNTVAPREKNTHNIAGFSDRVLKWIEAVECADPIKAVMEYAKSPQPIKPAVETPEATAD